MTPFSRRFTVCRRYIVIRYHFPFRIPVPLLSYDSSVEIPTSQRIRRESPIHFPDSPGDIMALGHSSPSTTQLITTPLSPQHMPAYANKWQGNFLIISYYDYKTTLYGCYKT
ncbi:hypothetical protein FGIG_12022 [Fasciola gigantica]|uniref:Uncharacterized protein n=1 Tax=Fasciola gigantica TaxID=46835 RepID=A0A504YQ39_FASGI|nr:hypothetical protein FGIG_12022 [Fasciola gigantica]